MMIRRTLARNAEQYVRPRCWHSVTSNAGGSSENPKNSRRALPEWLEIGKIDVNAACSPSFLRASGGVPNCRNARYEASWVSSRNGTGRTLARLAKLLRMRFFSVNEYSAMDLRPLQVILAGAPRRRTCRSSTSWKHCASGDGGWPLPAAGGRRCNYRDS